MSSKSPLPRGEQKHVVVIGGGATGALVAVKLAEDGHKVTVLEQRLIGNGSSARSAACIRAQFSIPETVLGMVYSEKWYERINDLFGIPEEERQKVIVQNGYLFLYEDEDACEAWRHSMRKERAASWKTARALAEMQQETGLPVEVLTIDEVQTRWPHLSGPRMDYMVGATFCQTDGFLRHDLVYTLGFRRARELGVTVMENAEVVGCRLGAGRRIAGVYLRDGTYIEADIVVNATNAWAVRVSELLGGATLPISPIKRYLAFTVRPEGFPEDEWDRLPMTIYGLEDGRVAYSRPDGGSLMSGWAHKTDPEKDFTSEDQDRIEPGFGPKDDATGEPYARAMIDQIFEHAPSLIGDVPVFAGEGTTCGYYGDTPDHNPLIGWDPGVKNLMHAAGFSGHGLMHAPYTAVIVAALASGQDEDHVIDGIKRHVIWLPTPWREEQRTAIDLARFAIGRKFDQKEGKVL